MGTPTIIFFCDGRPVESVAGFQQKERLVELVEDVLSNHRECIEKSTILKTD
jgi:thioredoxin-like negative regulator of GroEL